VLPSTLVMILLMALPVPTVAAGQATSARFVLAPVDTTVYIVSVSDSGRVEPLPFKFRRHEYGLVGHGDSGPQMSPDSRWVAFVRDRNLWILDLLSQQQHQVTSLPRDYDGATVCKAYVAQWSADSRRLLYSVGQTHNRYEVGVTKCPDTAIFDIYDVASGLSTPLELPGEFSCWLPNGDFALSRYDEEAASDGQSGPGLYRFAVADTAEPSRLLMRCNPRTAFCFTQVVSNLAGSRLAMVYWPPQDSAFRIAEFDLATGRLTQVPAFSSCSRCQAPSYSPTGKHLAVLEHSADERLDRTMVVRVDGRPVAGCKSGLGPDAISWLSDSTFAVTCGDSLQVFDVEDGKRVGGSRHVP
jgi:hypothetical protein